MTLIVIELEGAHNANVYMQLVNFDEQKILWETSFDKSIQFLLYTKT